MEDRNEGHFKSPHTKRGEVQPATNHATSCDSSQVRATYLNTQWHRQWLQNLALLYRKGNDASHQHAVFDRWLRRFARRCSCRACCWWPSCLWGRKCWNYNVYYLGLRARVDATGGRYFLARARASEPSTDVAAVPLVLVEGPRCEVVLYRCCYSCCSCALTSLQLTRLCCWGGGVFVGFCLVFCFFVSFYGCFVVCVFVR